MTEPKTDRMKNLDELSRLGQEAENSTPTPQPTEGGGRDEDWKFCDAAASHIAHFYNNSTAGPCPDEDMLRDLIHETIEDDGWIVQAGASRGTVDVAAAEVVSTRESLRRCRRDGEGSGIVGAAYEAHEQAIRNLAAALDQPNQVREGVVLQGTIHDVEHPPGPAQHIVFTPDPEFAGESWFNAHDPARVRITIEPLNGGGDGE